MILVKCCCIYIHFFAYFYLYIVHPYLIIRYTPIPPFILLSSTTRKIRTFTSFYIFTTSISFSFSISVFSFSSITLSNCKSNTKMLLSFETSLLENSVRILLCLAKISSIIFLILSFFWMTDKQISFSLEKNKKKRH